MKPGDYRRDYAAYCAALARARYDFHVGRAPELQLAPLHERYADLWTRERLAELEQAQRDTPAQFETERTALRRLLNVARLGYIAAQTREVAAELARCEAAAQIAWPDARVAATDAPTLIANEPDAPRRRELAARQRDALQSCDDLRAAQFDQRFPASDLARTYAATMSGLGIRVERQTNLRVEWIAGSIQTAAQTAQLFAQSARPLNAICFDLAPPTDVHLVVGTNGGAEAYRAFFQAAGGAQQLAWVSRDMAERYPEFVRGPDATTRAAYGFLFRHLLH